MGCNVTTPPSARPGSRVRPPTPHLPRPSRASPRHPESRRRIDRLTIRLLGPESRHSFTRMRAAARCRARAALGDGRAARGGVLGTSQRAEAADFRGDWRAGSPVDGEESPPFRQGASRASWRGQCPDPSPVTIRRITMWRCIGEPLRRSRAIPAATCKSAEPVRYAGPIAPY